MPRYFAVFEYGIWTLFILTGIYRVTLLVKFTCIDFVSFNLIRHFFVQSLIWLTAVCNFSVASSLFFPTVRIAVSSAKIAMVSFSKVGISQINVICVCRYM
jgi:hypothetical protein